MNLKELKALVAKGEGLHLEFKGKAAHPDKIMKEIVAFANTAGGMLMIGVDDNKTIPGLAAADEEEWVLEFAISKYCSPPIPYRLEKVALSVNHSVLVYHISPGDEKPYTVIEDFQNKTGTVYIRVADKSVQASREVKQILKQKRKDKSFRFQYGEKERLLMQYLEEHETITLQQFVNLAGISRKQASQTLILLVLSNILRIIPAEGEDLYELVMKH